ncbi:hypothetical protein BT63DRAFT_459128 [Microthyrium microscopicum]|uniref:Stress response protein ish1 n=1 Tax=Microthyrium microscopicum TaxID=703497 RepID=A0A6A6U354_9PEZI|nr:hypothetical protein BT63DRAFT_459128 [Microthyrium microscopicum]
MRFAISSALVALLAVDAVAASSWFGSTVYNKWHETELERWLSDHNIPYPTPSDRKDLEKAVKDGWNDNVVTPYNSWDTAQLSKYLSQKGEDVQKSAVNNKDALVKQVQSTWSETAEGANTAYGSVSNWIFDSWTESQLKSFCDYHGIPVPQPRTRDSLLKTVRSNYQAVAEKAGEYYSYPGDWLYASWSDSDLKAWSDERGIPVYQGGKRNELIASVRRNSRTASNNLSAWSSSLSSTASSATQAVSDAVFDTWSDSQLKKWADEKGLKVPQGSKRNEVLAVVRRQNALLNSEASKMAASASSAYGAATSSASNQYARASNDLGYQIDGYKSAAWSYIDWARSQVGLAASSASATATGLRDQAAASASSVSKNAISSASSASASAASAASSAASVASSSASSALSVASKAGDKNAISSASSAINSVSSVAAASASSASKSAASALSSASKAGDKNAISSASSALNSVGSVAASAASSASKSASSALYSASKAGNKSASKSAQKAYDAATESVQKARDYAKEEL